MRKIFPKLLGNGDTKKRLSALITSSSLPHALMISGAEGSGKVTLATEIAAAINCENKLSENHSLPCGVCSRCKSIYSASFPDVSVLRRDSGRAILGVDDLRAFRDDMFLSPTVSEYKCYIIEEADSMTPAAQNALLKVLEEPPRGVHIILTCLGQDKMLSTIKSRAQSVETEIFTPDELSRHVAELSPAAAEIKRTSPDKFRGVLLAAGGIIGKALSLMDEGSIGETEAQRREVISFIGVMPKRTPFSELYTAANSLPGKREELRRILELTVSALKDMLTLKVADEFNPAFFISKDDCERAAEGLSAKRIIAIYEIINSALRDIEKNVLIAPLLTDIALKIREA